MGHLAASSYRQPHARAVSYEPEHRDDRTFLPTAAGWSTWRTDPDDPRTALAFKTREVSHGIEYVANTFEITGTQTEIEIFYYGSNFDLEN